MDNKVILEKQDLTYLKWSHIRSSSGTAGSFLKSESILSGVKTYYKLSNFNAIDGVIGHECVNEIIVDRLLTLLGIEHLEYSLINADIQIDGRIYNAYLCASQDYKKHGESKVALDDYYRVNALPGESHYDFCVRNGWKAYIDTMIAIDYIILNRDRHGANIELLRNSHDHTLRIVPLFDHGLSLMYSCLSPSEISNYDILADKRCNNFIGGTSCLDNLQFIIGSSLSFRNTLSIQDRDYLFYNLDEVISAELSGKIWSMIYERYKQYENIRNSR